MSRSHAAPRSWLLVPLALVALAGARTAAAQCSGAPTFAAPVSYASGPGLPVSGIAHADLDGDGDLDLVTCAGPQVIVFLNQGTGTFSVQPPIPAPFNLVDVVTGDFDADGRPDIAAVGTAVTTSPAGLILQARALTYLNHAASGGIGFAGPTTLPVGLQAVTGSIGRALRAADLNADGILDLVVVDGNSSSVWVALGQGAFGLGNGTFGTATPYPINGTLHQDVAIGDFDQDGAPDLAVVRYGGCNCPTPVTLLAGVLDAAGVPTGAFAPAGSITIPGPSECENIETADLDGDGHLDLAISSYVSVELAWGTGGFGFTPATYALGAYPVQIAVGDFSADGRPDLATVRGVPASSAAANLSVLVGQPGVGFVGYDYVLDPSLPHCVDAADFDGDGRLDLAAGHSNGIVDVCLGTCSPAVPPAVAIVWPNGGEIVAAGIPTSIVWSKAASVALVDLDESYDGGATWRRIATDVSGTSTSWLPTPPGTGNAFVRVRASGTPTIGDASNYPFTIVGPGAASSTSTGPGCGPGLAPPSLTIGLPRLGLPVLVSVQGATSWSPGGVAVSPGQAAPIVFTPGCTVYIDPLSALLLDAIATDGSGDWSNSYPIPHLSFLAGSTIRAQAALLLPAGAFELTNGVELVLGF